MCSFMMFILHNNDVNNYCSSCQNISNILVAFHFPSHHNIIFKLHHEKMAIKSLKFN